jgi:thiamine biosynthesis lipoprotein
VRHVEACMGTVFSFDLRDGTAGLTESLAWLHHVDEVFSTYRSDSEISRLGRGEIALESCSAEVRLIIELCDELRRDTGGYFDAHASGALDPSGLVKGWAIESVHHRLLAAGSARHVINGGGDIRCCGGRGDGEQWRFGIASPFVAGELVATVGGYDFALATSGNAERGQHIFDPHTRRHPDELASISLVGADLTYVDAYATAAFAMGSAARAWLGSVEGVEGLAVTSEGETWTTPGWPTS